MNKFVRTKSHTGGKFSKTSLGLLCTWGIVVVHLYCGFSMWRQMAPQQTAKFRTAFFGQFFTSLRKDSVPNYGSILTLFPPSVSWTGRTLQRTKRFVVPSVGGATRIANLRRKFSKTQKNRRGIMPNNLYGYHWDSYELQPRNGYSCDNILPVLHCLRGDAFVSS